MNKTFLTINIDTMTVATINIFTKEEKLKYEHAKLFNNFDTVVPDGRELQLKNFIILEGGTAGGQPSVMLRMVDKDGKEFVVQTTGNIFDGMAHAFMGARHRFGL